MEKLTAQQQNLLSYIENEIAESGASPSYREIAKHFGFSSLGTVWRHIQTLKKKGALHQNRYTARSLSLDAPKNSAEMIVSIPFLGIVREGFPLETFARLEEKSVVWKWPHISPENAYLLSAKDTSFKQEMILPGDLLIIEGTSTAHPGQMALVLINQRESLIKRVFIEDEFIRLEASDSSVRSLILRKENVQIQGILLGLIRSF